MSTDTKKAKVGDKTYSTGGLYGTAKTGEGGTSYDPSAFEKNMVGTAQTGLNQYMNQLINPSYDSEVFRAQTAQRNKLANTSFENNLINPLAERGLSRGSTVNALSNEFAKNLADLEVAAMANEDNRNQSMINSLLGLYTTPYQLMSGMVGTTNAAYQNALQTEQARLNQESANNTAMINAGIQALGNVAGGFAKGGM